MLREVTERLAWVVVATLFTVVAGCGDSHVSIGPGVRPDAGVFAGETDLQGAIEIEVGSIEAMHLTCDGKTFTEFFAPPREIDGGGNFDVTLRDGSREFRVAGTFDTNDTVSGSIDDNDDVCDTSFSAVRTGTRTPVPTPTPTFTPGTPGPGTPTETAVIATATLTATPVTTTATPTVTFTPSPGPGTPTRTVTPTLTTTQIPTITPTPVPTATPFCGNGILDPGEQCDSGMTFGPNGGFSCRLGAQCGCCYCRPLDGNALNQHANAMQTINMTTPCTNCHDAGPVEMPALGAKPPKPGADQTFPNGVCD